MEESAFKDKTRGGFPVVIYATNGAPPQPIHGAILGPEGWEAHTWKEDGTWCSLFKDGTMDLVAKEPEYADD